MNPASTTREWLETDGLGGFASGTSTGLRTRRYHGLLLVATTPPTGRMALVNGMDVSAETCNGVFMLSSQCYAPGVVGGDGGQRIEAFGWEPWPHWLFKLEDGTRIELELFVVKGEPVTCLSWKLLGPRKDVKLVVRPFLSGRDYHSLHKSNPAFRFDADVKPDRVSWRPYSGVPGVTALTNGGYRHQPEWYYNFHYDEERARGLDDAEDLAAPGILAWNLAEERAVLVFTTTDHAASAWPAMVNPLEWSDRWREMEQRRRGQFPSRLHRAADAYLVRRGEGQTIIAGYPWFTDWGRDTLIALRGLCLATGRFDAARDILLAWSATVSEGMLPNRFPDQGGRPEFNAVDASLWFVVAVHEYRVACRQQSEAAPASRRGRGGKVGKLARELLPAASAAQEKTLLAAVEGILEGYQRGTRFGIRADADGLLACGVPGVQLTWMDAKVGDWVVTPRVGKPVEVQALWLNALWVASRHDRRWEEPLRHGLESFRTRFWNSNRAMLYDVVDVDHRPGAVDATFRPNQILAVGGLPLRLLEDHRAALIVEAVRDHLVTPLGLRSLARGEPGYAAHYQGGVRERDGAYHQGTVWPWLLGAFVDAWLRTQQGAPAAVREARHRYLRPLLEHLDEAGLGHISEIADAESPYTPRGCPWQAWSVGEALWLEQVVLAEMKAKPTAARGRDAADDIPRASSRTGRGGRPSASRPRLSRDRVRPDKASGRPGSGVGVNSGAVAGR